ncbi:MAG: beta strand repeat-containing protein, partial [Verrucomicrobiota bacterium]
MKIQKPRPLISRASLLAAAALVAVAPPAARAANFFWDVNGGSAGLGGTGTWDTTTANWFNAGSATTTNGLQPTAAIGAFTANDVAYFSGAAGSSNTVTLGQAITIGGLNFSGSSVYDITGAQVLTLAAPVSSGLASAPVVSAGVASRATVSARISGSQGLTKTGNGTLILGNAANNFTGDLLIRNGALVITNVAQLGAATSPILVQGLANTGNTGVGGGSLVLQGTSSGAGATGLTLTRAVSVSGRGAGPTNDTGALISVGYNTLGSVNLAAPMSDARIWATHGSTTISGSLTFSGIGQNNILYGNGNFIISGVVSGAETADDRFIKVGRLIGTTVWLQNAANSFNSSIRVDSGTVRVSENSALGRNAGANAVDLNNGWLEVRTDNPAGFTSSPLSYLPSTRTNTAASTGTVNPVLTFASTAGLVVGQRVTSANLPSSENWSILSLTGTTVTLVSGTGAIKAAGAIGANEVVTPGTFAGRNVRVRNNTTGTVFVDHGVSGSLGLGAGQLQNQSVALGTLTRQSGGNTVNYTIVGRNGFNVSFASALSAAADHRSLTLNNNTSGTVTISGNVWNANGSGTSIGTFTASGGGDTVINGVVFASNGRHSFTKGGSGTLTFTQSAGGTAATFLNNANVNDGTLQIRTIEVLNPNNTSSGRVLFGGGVLDFIGTASTGAGETWTNKVLDLNNANNYVQASQSGSAPTGLVVPNNFATSRTDARTLHLGGTSPSSVINQITGIISGARNFTAVTKYGSGTWEVQQSSQVGQTVTLNLDATGGTATTTVTLSSGSTAGLVPGQPVSGAGINPGSVIVQVLDSLTLILSDNRQANTVAGTASVTPVNGVTAALTNTLASTGTANPVITLASTAGLVPGQRVTSANLPASQNWYIRDITSGTTITLASGTGASLAVGAVALNEVITPELSNSFGGNL